MQMNCFPRDAPGLIHDAVHVQLEAIIEFGNAVGSSKDEIDLGDAASLRVSSKILISTVLCHKSQLVSPCYPTHSTLSPI